MNSSPPDPRSSAIRSAPGTAASPDSIGQLHDAARGEIGKVIVGQEEVVEQVLV